ncbi:MAG: DUF3375 domain-containing protein [Chloroflexota bacterium]
MEYSDVLLLHKTNPAVLALRKSWSPLAISFLFFAFKSRHTVSIPQTHFTEQLDQYIDYTNRHLAQEDLIEQEASYFLNRWSREDDLIRIRAQTDGYTVQLSPHAERLIGWFDEMQSQKMIGTESRLRNILSLLNDVVAQSSGDAQERLDQLYGEWERIEAEINEIEATGRVEQLSEVQIRERLGHISEMASQLLRDFSLVEERFREMTRAIQQAELEPSARRGDILGSALSADEQIQESDEGQSFRAFYELLTHPEQREQFDLLLEAVGEKPHLKRFQAENHILSRLTTHLLDAGERVNQSNRRLAEHLRRVVDSRNLVERRRVQALSREIKHLFGRLDGDQILRGSRRIFFEIEGDPDIEMPLERPLFEPPERFESPEIPRSAPATIDLETLTSLYETFYIDQRRLREQIERLLLSRAAVTLAELTSIYPVTQGVAEIVTYVIIAAGEPQHEVDQNRFEEITVAHPLDTQQNGTSGPITQLSVPRLLFKPPLAH